jgi:hypothetical protein
MRRHDMAKHIHRYLSDNGEGGRLDYFGELCRADGFAVTTRTARFSEAIRTLALQRAGFDAWAKLVIDADTDTLLGATFVGLQKPMDRRPGYQRHHYWNFDRIRQAL